MKKKKKYHQTLLEFLKIFTTYKIGSVVEKKYGSVSGNADLASTWQ